MPTTKSIACWNRSTSGWSSPQDAAPAAALPPDGDDPALSQLPPDVSTFGEESTGLPLIGRRPLYEQQRLLLTMVGAGAAVFVITGALSLGAANRQAGQLAATGQALMQSQRLAKSVSQALVGSPAAFPEVRESGQVLARNLRGLAKGNEDLSAVGGGTQDVCRRCCRWWTAPRRTPAWCWPSRRC
jgi:twitching motility protein PilJ